MARFSQALPRVMSAPRTQHLFILLTLAFGVSGATTTFRAATNTPRWAFPIDLLPVPPTPDDGSQKRVPGSEVTYTLRQIRDGFTVPDWHPASHPPMPDVVARGRRPSVRGCGSCHLPNGLGRPDTSSLAGLTAAYIAEQMASYRAGLRRTSEPRMGPPLAMAAIARAANDEEVRTAAAYFSAIAPRPWIRVVEAERVPVTGLSGTLLVPVDERRTEPLGKRIVEVPESRERAELHDATSGFVAYVPIGSVKRGEALVTTGSAGRTVRCTLCHGADLRGDSQAPRIAGRSPTYLARQLYDMQSGARHGSGPDLMMATVARLTEDDLASIAAYVASLAP